MKQKLSLFLILSLVLSSPLLSRGQTAKDFTANDCNGISHHLFSELDSGKIIVICFVMPCGTCIGPAQSAYTTVQEYAGTHPGKVRFYLADDYANTPCGTLVSWANNNGMEGVTSFSHQDVTQTPYSPPGMPKTLVLGGSDHKVHFEENDALNTTNLKNAINSAISLTSLPKEQVDPEFQLKLYPNPAHATLSVEYVLDGTAAPEFEIYGLPGMLLKQIKTGSQDRGVHTFSIDITDMKAGIYFLKMKEGAYFRTYRFTITH